VDFKSTAGYPVQGIRLSLLCVGGRSAGAHPAQPGGQARSAVQALDLDIVSESQSI